MEVSTIRRWFSVCKEARVKAEVLRLQIAPSVPKLEHPALSPRQVSTLLLLPH
jgi:hypothetical protein